MTEPPELQEQVRLAPFTSLGVGGPARYFATARDAPAVCGAVAWAKRQGLPVLVLGGGSNLVIGDRGFPGLVLQVAITGHEIRVMGDEAVVRASAGERWDDLVATAVQAGWAGLECLSGIPGSVGAAPIQNIGAYGQEAAQTISQVEALDCQSGALVSLSAAACRFGYRMSRFKVSDYQRYVILGVHFRLHHRPALIDYPDLQRALDERGWLQPTLTQIRAAVLDVRRAKSMLLDPADPNSRSVGSFFTNPLVSPSDLARISQAWRQGGGREEIPGFSMADGRIKIPAAWLIERAGFARGFTRGPVGLSPRHALAIINRGGATAREILAFAASIQERVAERFGVRLAPEPVVIDLDSNPPEQSG